MQYWVPWYCHGDGFRAFKFQKVMSLGFKSLRTQNVKDGMLLYCYLAVANVTYNYDVSKDTLQCLLDLYVDSMNMLAEGFFRDYRAHEGSKLDTRQRGKPICGPYRFGFAGVIGDMEFKRDFPINTKGPLQAGLVHGFCVWCLFFLFVFCLFGTCRQKPCYMLEVHFA